MPKTDLVYCLRIREAVGKIELYASGYSEPYAFFEANDQKDFNACLLMLLHIGEQVNKISELLKRTYEQLPWQAIKGFRNLIAHGYVGVDRLIVFDLLQQQLPALKQYLEHIIRTELQQGTFDKMDYTLSKDSSYYRHIEFDKIA
ncbi:DUF86 domain-containing protein [Fibrella sp. HMF5335]|uniref:DUF86 domain-containing protein n=1 Tax=Fibrella rubiginis TaxID=2817060 RepID=A0A939K6Q9_9BACT|nr:HepT-like ribonuclease domain-containing protein [Fibrella rubiginis]MBO0939113.1 DUF86 domain-containing protein [Fibrella rubiginis]